MPTSFASFLKRAAGPLFRVPTADGSAGDVLTTDGAGNLTFQPPSGGAVAAEDVTFTPAGSVAATDVQAAIEELDSEKSATGHNHDGAYDALGAAAAAVAAHEAAGDPHPQYLTAAEGNAAYAAAGHNHDGSYDPLGAAADVDADLDAHVADTTDAHDASAISVVPAGGIAATTVQAALEELDSEKAATGHNHDATYAPLSRALTAGNGLSGGGDLSADRSFAVNVDGATIEINTDALRVKDAGISYAKLQNISATQRLLARKTGGAGVVEECTLSEILDFIGSAAQGDILYRGASGWARLAAGTSGYYLQTQGAGANPQWAAVAGGGSAAIDINTQSSGYTLQATDLGDLIDFTTAGVTLTLLAAATAGDTFYCFVRHSGAVSTVLTVDGNSSETIDGALTLTMFAGEVRLLICDGSNWTSLQIERPVCGAITKPIDSAFAWINQDSAAIAATRGGLLLSRSAYSSVTDCNVRKKSAPATPYTVTAQLVVDAAYGGIGYGGLCFRQSSDGKLMLFGVGTDSANRGYTVARKMTNPTTYSADYSLQDQSGKAEPGRPIWLRIADNGTNRICSFSNTGEDFIDFHTVGRTDFLTADEIGFYINPYNRQTQVTLLSWKEA